MVAFAAMEAEAAPLLEALQLSRDEPPRIPPPAPCISFSGRVQDLDVHIVCNGDRDCSAAAFYRAMCHVCSAKGSACKAGTNWFAWSAAPWIAGPSTCLEAFCFPHDCKSRTRAVVSSAWPQPHTTDAPPTAQASAQCTRWIRWARCRRR